MSNERYPTDEEIERITKWPYTDLVGLMEFVRSIWWNAERGWKRAEKQPEEGDLLHQEPYTEFDISTGGWSGNEDLIDALQGNSMFWAICWVQSRRGGHYKFEVRQLQKTSKV